MENTEIIMSSSEYEAANKAWFDAFPPEKIAEAWDGWIVNMTPEQRVRHRIELEAEWLGMTVEKYLEGLLVKKEYFEKKRERVKANNAKV